MQIHVRLHGILRDKLPVESRGQVTLDFPMGATIATVLEELSLRRRIQVALNNEVEDNFDTLLNDGDRLDIFRSSAGGSV